MAFYLRTCFYMAKKITSLYWRLIGHKRHIKQYPAMVELVIFECVKLGYIWRIVCCLVNYVCFVGLQLVKENMCKLVKVECKGGMLGGGVVAG